MTIQDACSLLETIKKEAKRKQEIKTYDRFLYILTELNKREFSMAEIQSIETELDSLNIKSSPENRKTHIKKALNKFEKYLNNTFSLITSSYYTTLGIGLGASFGTVLGVVFMNSQGNSSGIGIGIAIGISIGIAIGHSMDAKAKAAGKVL